MYSLTAKDVKATAGGFFPGEHLFWDAPVENPTPLESNGFVEIIVPPPFPLHYS